MTLEQDLRALAEGFPDTPALAARVLPALQQASARRRTRRRVAVLALALFLLVPATALAVSPDLRNRVLETFGLRDVKVEVVEQLPDVGPTARRLQLGQRISLAQARTDLQLRVHAPSVLGAPDGIFEERLKAGFDVTFLYEPRTVAARIGVRKRVLVSIVRGKLDKRLLGKTIGAGGTTATFLEIDGGQALLLKGADHLLVLILDQGGGIEETYTRFAGTTLLWQRRAMLIRVEGNLPRARLVAIARSIATG